MVPGHGIIQQDVQSESDRIWTIPAYGYLFEIILRPVDRVLPNQDASRPYRLVAELIGPDGHMIPLKVTAICRDVLYDRKGER